MNANNERKTRATMRFMSWLRKFSPEMHAAVMERMGGREAPAAGALGQLSEAWDMFYPSKYYGGTGYRGRYHSQGEHLGQIDPYGGIGVPATTTTEERPWYLEALDFAKEAVPAYLAYDAQKDLMDLNMERAKQGLDPIDPGLTAPQVTLQHQLPPETRGLIDQMKMGGNILLWGGLGLAAFFLVRMIR
jgi:hypothetical protein